jgi:class 3 adenylate cyclase/tetratricopeptide (TPR) repeat protein
VVTCPSCGRANPDDARFCNACATLLTAAPPREERKAVTVLFADLVGYTARAEKIDAEHLRALLRVYHGLLRRELEARGGTVEKFIGDAVMAVFGAPVVHEDDPERAVRAAFAIQDAVREESLDVRIGITTGEALVSLAAGAEARMGMVAGDVVNTASRLEAAAPVDGILVDETTFRATERSIRYREHEPILAKGKTRPIPVWEALELRARHGVETRRSERAPFIGRERALTGLLEALDRVRDRGEPELVTVVGVPGIGKSRLVWELARRVDAAPEIVTWRQGRSLPYGEGVSFWALSEMVKAQSEILDTDRPDEAEAKLEITLASLPIADAAWVERHLRPLVGLAPADAGSREVGRSEAFAAWRRFFEALAALRPTVLVFEDLHWADEGLLDFVDHLLDWATGSPLLILATARPELFSRRPGWAAGRANATTLSLPPLTDEESTRLVDALSEGRRRPEALSLVLERAGGNPLYAEELTRFASERGLPADAPLPATVQGIIAARLDTLGAEEKMLLQDAAVLGRAFWTGGVATVGEVARWSVEEAMHRLERKEFVRRSRLSSVASETEYAFRHVLVRDVAYAQIPRSERAEKHRLAAEWIESLSAERVEEKAEMLAHHYRAALEFAAASKQDTQELTERARRALRDAGDRAAALNAWPAATRFYRDALELWPAEGERAGLHFEYGRAVFRAEGGAAEILTEALEALLVVGDHASAAEAELILGELGFWEGDRDAAFVRFERALELVADAAPSPSKAHVLSTLSRFYAVALEADQAIRYGRQALEMAQALGLGEVRAHALNNIGFARVVLGDRGGIEDLERSVAAAEELNSPEAIRAYLNLGHNLAHLGDLPGMFEADAKGRRAAERFGDAVGKGWFAAESLWEHYWRGEWDDAEELSVELLAAGETGSRRAYFEPGSRIVRAWIALARGQLDEALENTATLADFLREAQFLQVLFPALALHTHVLVACNRNDEAWAQARELLHLWRESGVNACSYWTADLAFALARLGRTDELLQPLAAAPRTRWTESAHAVAAHDPARAARMYAEIGSVPDEALARLLAAESLLARNRAEEARAEVDRALAFYRRVGASRYVAEGEALLAVAA